MSDMFRYVDPRAEGGGGGGGSPVPPSSAPAAPPAAETPAVITTGDVIFGRRWNLSLFKPKLPEGMDLSRLHITFTVKMQQWQTPSELDCTIYNVGDDIAAQLIAQFTRVVLGAGYMSPKPRYGTIFDGNVIYYEHKRLNATDTMLRVVANSWDQIFTEAVVNTTLPAGYTQADAIKACTATFQQFGVTQGKTADGLDDAKSPRGRTLTGMSVDVLRDITASNDLTCQVDPNGKINMIKKTQVISDTAFELNSKSGLINVAQQTLGAAVKVTSLLNPAIMPMAKIHINEKAISSINPPQATPVGLAASPDQQMQLEMTAKIRTNGQYRAFSVVHHGDTRGQPWYTEIGTEPINPDQQAPKVA